MTVTLTLCDGFLKRRAVRVGKYLCVHVGILTGNRNAQWFSITHIPTGMGVLHYFKSKTAAISMARELNAVNWNFKRPNTAKSRGPQVRELRDNFLNTYPEASIHTCAN